MFFQILRDYQTEFPALERDVAGLHRERLATYGQDLTWFVNQCVMRTGAPKYSHGWTNVTLGGQTYVAGNITQIHAGLPYRFPVDVRVTTAVRPDVQRRLGRRDP